MTVETIDRADRFAALRADWTDLLASSAAASPFLTWEWLHAWWEHLSGSRKLALVAVRDGDRLVALAPLASARGRLPFLRRLELLGTGFAGSDYLDAIVRYGFEEQAASAFAQAFRAAGAALHLDHLPVGSALSRLSAPLADAGWWSRRTSHGVCPYIRLAGHTWDSFLATIGPSNRATTRRRLRSLEHKHAMRFERVMGAAERRDALGRLFAFHEARFGARQTAFHTRALRAFHLDVTTRLEDAGMLRLYALRLDEEIAAVMYGMAFKDRFYFYQHGHDPRFQALGAGRAVLDLSIRAAIGEGLAEFDLLYGSESYKSAWTSDHRTLERLELFPPHLAGRLHQRAVDTERTLRALARRVISGHVPQTH